jgi:hypothetical protein
MLAANATAQVQHYDVILAGDLTAPGDRSLRLALEIEHYRALGAKVGLIHAGSRRHGNSVSAELAASVRRGRAEAVDTAAACAARLLILHAPSELEGSFADLTAVEGRKLIVVAYSEGDFDVPVPIAASSFETRQWAAVSRAVRGMAPAGTPLMRGLWLPPVLLDSAARAIRQETRSPAGIGWLVSNGAPLSILDQGLHEVFAVSLDGSRPPLIDDTRFIDLSRSDVAPSRLLDRLAALAFYPDVSSCDAPDAVVRSALARGLPVALPASLQKHFGDGPIYADEDDAAARLATVLDHASRGPRRSANAKSSLPIVRGTQVPSDVAEAPTVRPVMFIVGGSVGVGHTARLLSIARRMRSEIPVIFVCQAHTVATIEKLGYVTEHIPSASYVGGSVDAWNGWLRYRLDQLLSDYDPSLVAFDGNHLYPGMIGAIAARPDCRFAWVRRGLWGGTNSPYLSSAFWCDLIVEPGELPGQPDDGITAQRKAETLRVDPIQLLDARELLGRAEACKALGLDPKLPAVLVQLGANAIRETASILHEVVGHLRKYPKLQVCIAEFASLETEIGHFPGVTYVRGYPLSQYLRAFDFAISAAGYNTFHEAISLDLPTIFIPNRDPAMDDQGGRASFAQERGAAFEIDAEDLGDLPNLIQLLLEPKGRTYLSQSAQGLRRTNGAIVAAGAFERLAG